MIMSPSLLLPLVFVDVNNRNKSFDGNFSTSQLEEWQNIDCYYQKWERGDTLILQLISEEPLTDLKILNIDGVVVQSVEWEVSPVVLPDYHTYSVYNLSFPFIGLSVGRYIIQQDNFEAEVIEVGDDFPETVKISYTHSENEYSTIFNELGNQITFEFRIEGWIGNYQPKNDRDVFNDQTRNLTQLNSIAYPKYSLKIRYGSKDCVLGTIKDYRLSKEN